MWKRATTIEEPALLDCGWDEDGDIQWVTEIYPDTVEDILFDIDGGDDIETDYGNELESEDEVYICHLKTTRSDIFAKNTQK